MRRLLRLLGVGQGLKLCRGLCQLQVRLGSHSLQCAVHFVITSDLALQVLLQPRALLPPFLLHAVDHLHELFLRRRHLAASLVLEQRKLPLHRVHVLVVRRRLGRHQILEPRLGRRQLELRRRLQLAVARPRLGQRRLALGERRVRCAVDLDRVARRLTVPLATARRAMQRLRALKNEYRAVTTTREEEHLVVGVHEPAHHARVRV
eukprot:1415037-Pleurochrysis_carterae.AAC.1